MRLEWLPIYFKSVCNEENVQWSLEFASATDAKLPGEHAWQWTVCNDLKPNRFSTSADWDVDKLKHPIRLWVISHTARLENAGLNAFVAKRRMYEMATCLNYAAMQYVRNDFDLHQKCRIMALRNMTLARFLSCSRWCVYRSTDLAMSSKLPTTCAFASNCKSVIMVYDA